MVLKRDKQTNRVEKAKFEIKNAVYFFSCGTVNFGRLSMKLRNSEFSELFGLE